MSLIEAKGQIEAKVPLDLDFSRGSRQATGPPMRLGGWLDRKI